MQYWEYKTIYITESHMDELLNRENINERFRDLGKQGFELVNVVSVKVSALSSLDNKEFDEMRYYFKRPIQTT